PPSGLSEDMAWKVTTYISGLRATAIDTPVSGDALHGEQIFWGKGQCGNCHMLHGRGGLSGPDLSDLGNQRQLSTIRNALSRDEDRHVFTGAHDQTLRPLLTYKSVRITTRDGSAISGILKNEDDYTLQILGSDNQLYSFNRSQLKDFSY